jgi:hypothetical protein
VRKKEVEAVLVKDVEFAIRHRLSCSLYKASQSGQDMPENESGLKAPMRITRVAAVAIIPALLRRREVK